MYGASTDDAIAANYRLYDAENRDQSLLDLLILSFHQLLLPCSMLEVLIWLL